MCHFEDKALKIREDSIICLQIDGVKTQVIKTVSKNTEFLCITFQFATLVHCKHFVKSLVL